MRRWEGIVTQSDREVLEKMGWGKRQPYGRRPALLVIDVTTGFIGSSPKSILEAVNEYPTSCGETGWVAIPYIRAIIQACRTGGIPIIYTTGDTSAMRFSHGPTKDALPRTRMATESRRFPEAVAPLSSDLVIAKTKASAFFGTPLLTCLQSMGKDSLLITGCVTSGCVRATVVDAFSYGYACFVVEEGTFDRFEICHLVNLFDMNTKYADVITTDEAIRYIEEISTVERSG